MTAREIEKADEAARRRYRDELDRVVEAIGELLSRRASRRSLASDSLRDLHVDPMDIATLGTIAAELCVNDEDPEKIEAAFFAVSKRFEGDTVEDLAKSIVLQLYGHAAEVSP